MNMPSDFPLSGIEFLQIHKLSVDDYLRGRVDGSIVSSIEISGRESLLACAHTLSDSIRFSVLKELPRARLLPYLDDFLDFCWELEIPPEKLSYVNVLINATSELELVLGCGFFDMMRAAEILDRSTEEFSQKYRRELISLMLPEC